MAVRAGGGIPEPRPTWWQALASDPSLRPGGISPSPEPPVSPGKP